FRARGLPHSTVPKRLSRTIDATTASTRLITRLSNRLGSGSVGWVRTASFVSSSFPLTPSSLPRFSCPKCDRLRDGRTRYSPASPPPWRGGRPPSTSPGRGRRYGVGLTPTLAEASRVIPD